MNTIKTIVVTATLLAVGYGANIVLNKPTPGDGFGETGLWNDAGDGIAGSPSPRKLKIPDLDGNDSAPRNPFAVRRKEPASAGPVVVIPDEDPNSTASNPAWPDVPTPNVPRELTPPQSFADNHGQGTDHGSPGSQTRDETGQPTAALHDATASLIPSTAPDTGNAQSSHTGPVSQPSFETTWAVAQEMIQTSDLSGALFKLSELYRDNSLTSDQRDQLISTLDQLAGSVIYSTQHTMQPAYVSPGGESLERVATQYKIPVEFLARVNGIRDSNALAPGQTLKVIEGPFRGELSRSSQELTLFLGRSYAGRFSVAFGRDFPADATVLQVTEKTGPRPYIDVTTGRQIAAGAPDNPYGSHWIGLTTGAAEMTTATPLGMHSAGAAVDASDTRGCIGLSREDADDLQAILSVGSQITIVP